ncbi:MAG: peroxiredoxin [Myxococcales bacterium]
MRSVLASALLVFAVSGSAFAAAPPPPAKPAPAPVAVAAPAPAVAPPVADSGVRVPLIGETAPSFVAETTQGTIHFPEDYKGKWVVLFSHPADFTPVCTTEFMTFATMMNEFKALNTELVGLSIDSIYSHIAWLRSIKEKVEYKGMKNVEVTFPLIADLKMDVAKKYGMLQPSAADTKAVRAVFFIDPTAKIRALIYYPLSNGRNFQEIKRLLVAMQTSDKHGVATPADWKPGDEVIVPPPGSCGTAKERMEKPQGMKCNDWFFCTRKTE